MSGAAIDVRDFVMRFGERNVVDGLSFDIAPGETFVILGAIAVAMSFGAMKLSERAKH